MLLIFCLPLLQSCTVIPRSGPTQHDVYKSRLYIPIVPLTLNIAKITQKHTKKIWIAPDKFAHNNYESLGVGDKLDINIWENATEGLFTGNQKGPASLGPVIISEKGTIYIPYVGQVTALGLTPQQLQEKLTSILENKVINPQIAIKKIEAVSKQISIQGVVPKSGMYEISPGRYKLVQFVAEAGGSTIAPELTEVMLERKGQQFKTSLAHLFNSSPMNISLKPGDNVILTEVRRSFVALGSTGIQNLIKFPKSELSLIEAISLAQGLNDEKANPSSVFVLRYEANSILEIMTPSTRKRTLNAYSPVIYSLNMKHMGALFSAQQFQIRDGDLILTTNAPYTNVRKLLSSLSPAIGLGANFAAA